MLCRPLAFPTCFSGRPPPHSVKASPVASLSRTEGRVPHDVGEGNCSLVASLFRTRTADLVDGVKASQRVTPLSRHACSSGVASFTTVCVATSLAASSPSSSSRGGGGDGCDPSAVKVEEEGAGEATPSKVLFASQSPETVSSHEEEKEEEAASVHAAAVACGVGVAGFAAALHMEWKLFRPFPERAP